LKKEIFFKNIGEELELTVRPYKNGINSVIGGFEEQK
jgi:hypothetical protein